MPLALVEIPMKFLYASAVAGMMLAIGGCDAEQREALTKYRAAMKVLEAEMLSASSLVVDPGDHSDDDDDDTDSTDVGDDHPLVNVDYITRCPPGEVYIEDAPLDRILFDDNDVIEHGRGSSFILVRSDAPDEVSMPTEDFPYPQIVFKKVVGIKPRTGLDLKTVFDKAAVDQLVNEKAMLTALKGVAGVQQIRTVSLTASDGVGYFMSSECRSHSMVTDDAGEFNLAHDFRTKDAAGRMPGVGPVIARALEILQSVHDRGIVHGNIQASNFVFSDIDGIADTLQLIDFGKAKFFISAPGKGLRDGREWVRGDLVRLAAMGVELEWGISSGAVTTSRESSTDCSSGSESSDEGNILSPSCSSPPGGSPRLVLSTDAKSPIINFYNAVAAGAAKSKFNYEKWIEMLRSSA